MATFSADQPGYWLWIVQNGWAEILAHCAEQGGQEWLYIVENRPAEP